MVAMSARARSSVTPGPSLATTVVPGWLLRSCIDGASANRPIGTHRSATCGPGGNANPAGMTPTTVNGFPLNTSVRPMMDGSLPKRRTHSAWLSTTTRSAPGLSSSAVKTRPRAGATPSI